MRHLLIAILLAITFCATFTPCISAETQPDAINIVDVKAFRHLLETDDMLVVVHYDIAYADLPDDPAYENFIFRLMDGATPIGNALPYAHGTFLGYNEGIVSFYYSADDAPAWGGDYTVLLQGNPAIFDDAEDWSIYYNMMSSNWSIHTTQQTNQYALWLCVVDMALSIQANWGIDLLVSSQYGDVLNTDGEAYLLRAIPGIRSMTPDSFSVRETTPIFDPESYDRAYDTSIRTSSSGTAIGSLVNVIERNMSIPFMAAGTLITLIIYVVIILITYHRTKELDGGILVGLPVVLVSVRLGLVPMAGIAIFALIAVMLVGYTLFFRNA